jgi:hypothetical protein
VKFRAVLYIVLFCYSLNQAYFVLDTVAVYHLSHS